jgi:hypothetical protein
MRLITIINHIKLILLKILLNIIIFNIIIIQRSYEISMDTFEYLNEKLSRDYYPGMG